MPISGRVPRPDTGRARTRPIEPYFTPRSPARIRARPREVATRDHEKNFSLQHNTAWKYSDQILGDLERDVISGKPLAHEN